MVFPSIPVKKVAPSNRGIKHPGRIFSPPIFDVPAQSGGDHLQVNDAITQGPTFAAIETPIIN